VDDVIGEQWAKLYSFNPKIQAFAVVRGSQVVWQTSNWDLVPAVEQIEAARRRETDSITIAGVEYKRVYADETSFVATSDDLGHLLMSQVRGTTWVVAWAISTADPEMASIDLDMAAIALSDAI